MFVHYIAQYQPSNDYRMKLYPHLTIDKKFVKLIAKPKASANHTVLFLPGATVLLGLEIYHLNCREIFTPGSNSQIKSKGSVYCVVSEAPLKRISEGI